ncbi:MAG: glycosyltransferase [Flavobacteriales bacterium]|nr:glycosyltransferase [Flavobacteriales bacterium]
MSAKKSHLIIVCSNFPFGYGEPFLEVELEYLVKRFDQITICRTDESGKAESFKTPSDVNLISVFSRISFLEKLTSIWRLLFDAEMREEMRVIRSHYHSNLTLGKLKTMVSSKIRALKIKKGLERLMVQTTDYETYLYSYWSDDAALAISFIRSENQNVVAFSRIHGWDLYFERSSYHYLPFRKTIFNGLDAVFAISENGKNYLLSHFDTVISKGRIFQSRLGIRTVNQSEDYSRTFRRFRLVSCSNLIAIKRVGLIVQALSKIDDLEIDWVHFGSGAEESSIKQLAEEHLGTKGNIEFHFPGRVANWQVLKYYSEHMVDLFISLSQYDGIPVSIMEAMSFGIPAIATNVGGVSEIVINGKTGFLLDQDIDPKHVANVIENVAKMKPDEYEAMRMEARKMWGTFYSADINYPAFCDKVLSLKQS